jgi:5-methylcytosine-specific restriction endonuclease McrBC regulatory subunit McrC
LQNGTLSLILDTKYKEPVDISEKAHVADVAQLVLYSISTGVKKLGLIYVGNCSEMRKHAIKSGITLYVLCFNLLSSNISSFEQNCSDFFEDVKVILTED